MDAPMISQLSKGRQILVNDLHGTITIFASQNSSQPWGLGGLPHAKAVHHTHELSSFRAATEGKTMALVVANQKHDLTSAQDGSSAGMATEVKSLNGMP